MWSELSIQAVSRRSGVASSALRYYEERGLIASQRARSGHRCYARAVLRRIAFIVYARRIGLSLEEIGTELGKRHCHTNRFYWSVLTSLQDPVSITSMG